MVAMPVIRHLGKMEDVHLTVASDNEQQAVSMLSRVRDYQSKTLFQNCKFPEDMTKVAKLIKDADVVISLLPATMHVPFAELAVKYKKHLITASYVSEGMLQLSEAAKKNGVILLNGRQLWSGYTGCIFCIVNWL